MKLNKGIVLIALDPCPMDDGSGPALTVGNEYITQGSPDSQGYFNVTDALGDSHSYHVGSVLGFPPIEDEPLFFKVKEDKEELPEGSYERLLDRDAFLTALEAAGVDNWSGYDQAQEILEEWNNGD